MAAARPDDQVAAALECLIPPALPLICNVRKYGTPFEVRVIIVIMIVRNNSKK